MTRRERWRLLLGRRIVHFGLNVMPEGKVKRELWGLFVQWSQTVLAEKPL